MPNILIFIMAHWLKQQSWLSGFVFRIWYRIISKLDRNGELVFMNYGYCDGKPIPGLEVDQEANRTCIQLYDQLISGNDISDGHILEVGSGRGGGLSYVTRRYNPKMATGLDLDKSAVSFCNKKHGHESLRFVQGNAQKLPFEDNSIDVVINVESSHRYDKMEEFLSEVKRILKPGGSFFITDFRFGHHIDRFKQEIENSGLNKLSEKIITPFVAEALRKDDHRRRDLINRLVPLPLRNQAAEFAGVVGSKTYRFIESGEWLYMNYHLRKGE